MTSKIIEIRDRGTFIPALAIQMGSDDEQERWLLAKAGYGITGLDQKQYVVLCQINGGSGKCACDPFDWGQNPRTYFVAHKWLIEHFAEVQPGGIVDVQYILGETLAPKISDRKWEVPK